MNADIVFDEERPEQQSVVDYKKNQKQRKLLAHLYAEETCTLARLTRVLHSSVPSVTNLVDELIQDQWVTPIGMGSGSNGRRPVLFGLNSQYHHTVVLDISTHDTKILFMNTQRTVVHRCDYPLQLINNPDYVLSLVDCFRLALNDSGLALSQLMAVGVSMPGLVDARRGINLTYKNLSKGYDSLTQCLSEKLSRPVYILNDTKATVLGESRFGNAKGKQQMLAINIDWGVGLGILVNGHVFQGASGFAGELGHIQVEAEGELCHCGKIGCLDTVTSASALVRRVQRDVQVGQVSKLAVFRHEVDKIDIDEIISAARHGDSYAIDILHEAGLQLGKGLSVAISLFNPEVIIIDGVLAQAATFILNTIEQAINKYCLSDFRNDLTIEITQLNGAAKWLGTHAYMMEDIFANY